MTSQRGRFLANVLWLPPLLAACHHDDAEPENPFDDWGPYKNCEQDVVYMEYDEADPAAEPYPSRETMTAYTAQGGLLQRSDYISDEEQRALWETILCSYDEISHAPLGCETFSEYPKTHELYATATYSYRADRFLAWRSLLYFTGDVDLLSETRDESDRVVRVDYDSGSTDPQRGPDADGVPDASEVWIYDDDNALPREVDTYWAGIVEDDYLYASNRYTVEDDLIVHAEYATAGGDVYEVHDYTYNDDGHLLTDVRDGGWESFTLTWDRDFMMTETHEIAWDDLSDVRIDYTAAATYECEHP